MKGFFGSLVFLLTIVGPGEAQNNAVHAQVEEINSYHLLSESNNSYYFYNAGNSYMQYYTSGDEITFMAINEGRIEMKCECRMQYQKLSPNPREIFEEAQSYCEQTLLYLKSADKEGLLMPNATKNLMDDQDSCHITFPESSNGYCCGWQNMSDRIKRLVGGGETGVNEFPMMAGLIEENQKSPFCGGTIINDRQILTAAHCVFPRVNTSNLRVVVGEHDFLRENETDATESISLSNIVLHPEYNPTTLHNDLAILTTERVIKFSERVGPACLPFHDKFEPIARSEVTILGWGALFFGGPRSSVLHGIQVEVVDLAKCEVHWENYPYKFIGTEFCTIGNGEDSCQMDSGGPILWQAPGTTRLILVGIISFGYACGLRIPAINLNISNFENFILAERLPETQYCLEK